MKIVSEFPAQVIVLKGTQAACGLNGNAAQFSDQVIDTDQTAGFSEFCRALSLAQSGNKNVQRQLLENGREAHAHLEKMLVEAAGMSAAFADIAASYTPAELKVMRQPNAPYPHSLLEKTSRRVLELAAVLMDTHPAVTSFPSPQEAPDRFLFRIALAGLVLATKWISVGGAHLAKPEKLRNDQVDINFLAFATYYDGLFTADRRLASIYDETKLWLDHVFSRREEDELSGSG